MRKKEDPEALFLLREAALTSMALCNGLTNFRLYKLSQDGFQYQSFFSLSIGLERLLKLILIYDFRVRNNNEFPSNGYLKKFGHKISDLFSVTEKIVADQGLCDLVDYTRTDEIFYRIISFMNDFALQARYYNLDGMGGMQPVIAEPLERWDNDINNIIISRHYKIDQKEITRFKAFSSLMGNSISVYQHNSKGEIINKLEDVWVEESMWDCKRQYSVYYSFLIIQYLSKVFAGLEYKLSLAYPCLREFFDVFRMTDANEALQRITWDPYDPYSKGD